MFKKVERFSQTFKSVLNTLQDLAKPLQDLFYIWQSWAILGNLPANMPVAPKATPHCR